MPTLQSYQGTYLWHYVPSLPASAIFAGLFGLVTAIHTWRMTKTRMWFCLPFVLGGLFEVIGFVARAAAANSTGSLPLYLIQAIFLVIPPVFFAASLYMVYSRVVRAVQGADFSPIPLRWATRIFVLGDWLCLNVQSTGSGLLANPKNAKIGNYIIVGGLVLQVLLFVGFIACCLVFNRRFRAHVKETGATRDVPWQSCLTMLYSTSLAILVRNIYRVVEFVMGEDAYLFNHEWPAYAFDGALMWLVMVGFFIWYPSQLQSVTRDAMIELTTERERALESLARLGSSQSLRRKHISPWSG